MSTHELKPCCADESNRAEGPGPRGHHPGWDESRTDLSVTHCTVCECRHIEIEVDPVKLGITVTSL